MSNFVTMSLETHLFFARIMKEHSLFLQAGFQPPGEKYRKKADWFRRRWEDFLGRAVRASDGIVAKEVLDSGEIVTEFTRKAERQTSHLTGISIDGDITEAEYRLRHGCLRRENPQMTCMVRKLNEEALQLLSGLIDLKQNVLEDVEQCRIFTVNYPLLIEHIIREAKLYCSIIRELNEKGEMCPVCQKQMEAFWNRIMMEHALFIRGLLDPSEEKLIDTADEFAKDYKRLLEKAKEKERCTMDEMTRKTIEETIKYRDFKEAGTEGIIGCEIYSIILPLLADHVLREANHYLRILIPKYSKGGKHGTM